jgi:Kef-type K+ transport system membrane component KefB
MANRSHSRRSFFRLLALVAACALCCARPAFAAADAGAPDLMPVLEALVLLLLGARLGGAAFARMGQPAVLGELLAGIVLGNLPLVGVHAFEGLRAHGAVDTFAQIGVLFLLFQTGLASDVKQMAAVGRSALTVAVLGVVAPMALGFVASRAFFPDHALLTHLFVGATLTATSVGITARVLGDLGRTGSVEGRIILGAAVIDDVLGLIVLAVVTGVIAAADQGRAFSAATVLTIVAKALGFLAAALLLGRWLSPAAFRAASRLHGEGLLLTMALVFCFAMAWLAARAGLAPIIGAFAAGLVLEEVHYADLLAREKHARSLNELLEPIAGFLVPLFFVLVGLRVDLRVFARTDVMFFAAVLTLAAVAGKQLCSLGVLERGADRLAVGLGMIPRGEVGLIFAGIGSGLMLSGQRVVDDAVFSAVVVMVVLTTLCTPPLLAWRLGRRTAPTSSSRS